MAEYGSNKMAVQFQRNEIAEPLPANKSQALPAHTPTVAGVMPGGNPPKPARGAMKNLPWRSWLKPNKPGLGRSKRAKRKSSLGTLMGR
jgi:hypothetical protein